MIYIALALLYGRADSEWYIVSAGTDLEKVKDAATLESADRVGKYAISVEEIAEDGNTKTIMYLPSICGEKSPRTSARSWAAKYVGMRVVEACECGKAMLPDIGNSGYCHQKKVEVPDWLRNVVKNQLAIGELIEKARADIAAAEQPEPDKDEQVDGSSGESPAGK